jgi:hypothetical protein
MFYTIVSRIPYIISTNSKKFFKIFLLGSILYILVHYYLFSGVYNAVFEAIKHYLYYIMGADLIVAFIWSKLSRKSPDTNTIEFVKDNKDKDNDNDVMKQIAELKALQREQDENNNDSKIFKKDENTESEIPLFKQVKNHKN